METQYHQGLRLKKFIEKSGKKTVAVCKLAGVPKSSYYEMIKKKELLPSTIRPLLSVINISETEFYEIKKPYPNMVAETGEHYNEYELIQSLKRENSLLREQIIYLKELLKQKPKK